MVLGFGTARVFELRVSVPCLLHGLEIISTEILIRDLDVPQRHFDVSVSEQLHDTDKTDTVSKEFGGVGMAAMSQKT